MCNRLIGVGIRRALVPLTLDGFSHLLNDILAGVTGVGFRETNAWLAALTGNIWPAFYAGDQAGAFNWWMRLVTGVLAAWALTFALSPRLERVPISDPDRASARKPDRLGYAPFDERWQNGGLARGREG